MSKLSIKDDVYHYLNDKSEPTQNILDLTFENISENFRKNSKKELKDALKELERDANITTKDVHFRIFIPEDHIKNIPKDYRRFFMVYKV